MIEDLRQLPPGADIDADLCIVGGGAAGITLARSLAAAGRNCLLLESGGLALEADVQARSALEVTGLGGVDGCQLRYLGGATNHWGGWCRPLDADDFARRDWVADSGWPIDAEALAPYYSQAQAVCGLPAWDYQLENVAGQDRDFGAFAQSPLALRPYQFSRPPLRFGEAYRDELGRSDRVRVLLHANVTGFETAGGGRAVAAVRLQDSGLPDRRVRARCFVLACGGFENVRLLLQSHRQAGGGFGNDRDLVGRYFAQHPHVSCASLLTPQADQLERLFSRFAAGDLIVRATVGAGAQARQSQQLLNGALTLDRLPDPVTGVGAARALWRDLRNGEWPDEFSTRLWQVVSDLDSFVASPDLMAFYARLEQAPNPDSRILLSDQVDAQGVPLPRVDWRLSAQDADSLRALLLLVGAEFARLGLGRVQLPEWLLATRVEWPADLWGGCHLMGGTRMAADPARGVVDGNSRVHGMDNLYLAGSSVFPTTGFANPTLTLTALTLRLADHLLAQAPRS